MWEAHLAPTLQLLATESPPSPVPCHRLPPFREPSAETEGKGQGSSLHPSLRHPSL